MDAPGTVTPNRMGRQEGFALPATILALMILGMLTTAGFVAATMENRIGVSTLHGAEAFYSAQRGLEEFLGTKGKNNLDSISVGTTKTYPAVSTTSLGLTSEYTIRIRRIRDAMFYIESTGRITNSGKKWAAARRVSSIIRTRGLGASFDQAIKVYGPLSISGNADVSGYDSVPIGWTDCEDKGGVPGVIIPSDDSITYNGVAYTITGIPNIQEKPTMTTNEFVEYGDITYDTLKDNANIVYVGDQNLSSIKPNPLIGTTCTKTDTNNWGDPLNPLGPCHFYFPIIHVQGDLRVGGNSYGQGILLVDGNLTFQGGFTFYGVVIVRGTIQQGNGSGTIYGSVLAQSYESTGSQSQIAGNPDIIWSSCPIKRLQLYADYLYRAQKLPSRSWQDVSAAGATMY